MLGDKRTLPEKFVRYSLPLGPHIAAPGMPILTTALCSGKVSTADEGRKGHMDSVLMS